MMLNPIIGSASDALTLPYGVVAVFMQANRCAMKRARICYRNYFPEVCT